MGLQILIVIHCVIESFPNNFYCIHTALSFFVNFPRTCIIVVDQCKLIRKSVLKKINPFLANNPILYPQKKNQKISFSGVFRGYKMGILARNGSKNVQRKNWTEQLFRVKQIAVVLFN